MYRASVRLQLFIPDPSRSSGRRAYASSVFWVGRLSTLNFLLCLSVMSFGNGAWYSPDQTVTTTELQCFTMDDLDNPEQGRLCAAEQAYYDPHMQSQENYDFLGSTPLLRLQVPTLPTAKIAKNDCSSSSSCQTDNVTEIVNFFGDIYLEHAATEDFEHVCTLAHHTVTGPPVVFMVRDHSQLAHVLTVQLAPLLAAVKAAGWDHEPFQLVAMDRRSTHPLFRSEDDIFRGLLEEVSGMPIISRWDWLEPVCLGKVLVGVGGRKMMLAHNGDPFFSELQTDAEVAFNRDVLSDMQEAVWTKYGISASKMAPNTAHPNIVIVDRGPFPQSRRIINQRELLAAAQQFGDAQLVVLQKLSFQEQVELMSRTDIFMGTHGSGQALMVFLPPHAVTVEIKAYRHGLARDYTHGHCNLARSANRTLLEWHNKWAEHTRPWEGGLQQSDWWKQHHTFIPSDQIDLILKAAIGALQQPISERDFNVVNFLNNADIET